MEDKNVMASKATWGALIIGLQPFLSAVGVDINADAWASNIAYLIGAAIFFWGQRTRNSTLNFFGKKS